jgi:hypothetical protein
MIIKGGNIEELIRSINDDDDDDMITIIIIKMIVI